METATNISRRNGHRGWRAAGPLVPATIRGEVSLPRLATLPAEAVLGELGVDAGGLSHQEAAARLAQAGPNRLPQARGPSLPRQFAAQLLHFFALLLWVAAVLAFIGQMPQLGWAIIAVVIVNGAFSFVQEYRAERATRALAALLPEEATALRDGRKRRVPAADLVPGDILLLTEGDRVSVDARVLQSDDLKVDNAALTGESEPVPRSVDALAVAPSDPAEAPNLVFAGTYVASGSGWVVVVATGARTRLGAISRLTGEVARRPTPLRLDLNRSVRTIGGFAVGTGVVFFGVSLALGTPLRAGFLFAVGVIVALVPEGLLPTLTLSLAMSATRMARRGALVRHLEAVETLGSTTVICSDKTGTLTANQMTARAVAVAGAHYRAAGIGYDPAGALLAGDRPLTPRERAELQDLLRAAVLCNDAHLERHDGRWRCVGDPTEGALLTLAAKGGLTRQPTERAAPRAREYPFESARRRMSTAHRLATGGLELFTKGSPEAVLEACTSVRVGAHRVQFDPGREAAVLADVEALAADGLRVLALARRELDGQMPPTAAAAEQDLELLGLVGMADPVRPEVPEAIARCRRAGIRVVMVTGDHPATAAAVAAKAGLANGRVMLGADLPAGDDTLAELLQGGVSVLARIAPEQKLRIAKALQARGAVVAMTGDGVNDAPALRQADIGVAMGVVGTDVARSAADIVLLDDNFAHIVEAVEEGRAAFDNIKRFLTYHLTDNVAELAPFALWALTAGRVPLALSVLQILALDIGTDLLPALALGAEPPEPGVMERQPRTRSARSLDRAVLARAFGFLGPVEAVASLALLPVGAALFFGWRPGTPLPAGGPALATLSTMVFAAIVLAQMANAFECRSSRMSLRTLGLATNRLLVGAVAVEGLALGGFVYLGPIQALLGHQPLTLGQWLPVLVAPVLLFAAEEARKAVIRRHTVDRHPANRPKDPEPSDRPRLALAGEDAGPDEVRRDERQVDLPSLGGSRRWR
jgi:P-type Ca2+ transporter type 2C